MKTIKDIKKELHCSATIVRNKLRDLENANFPGIKRVGVQFVIEENEYKNIMIELRKTIKNKRGRPSEITSIPELSKKNVVITLGNSKGGVGKSTNAIALAQFCARILNLSVLFVDTDHQNTGTSFFDAEDTTKNMFTAIYNEDMNSNIQNTFIDNIDIIQSSNRMASQYVIPLNTIKSLLKKIEKQYDIIIFDTHNSCTNLEQSVCLASDVVLCPDNGTAWSVGSTGQYIRDMLAVSDDIVFGVFLNDLSPRNTSDNPHTLRSLREQFISNNPITKSYLMDSIMFSNSSIRGLSSYYQHLINFSNRSATFSYYTKFCTELFESINSFE